MQVRCLSLSGRFAHLAAGAILFVPAIAFSLISSESFRFPKLWTGQGLILLLAAAALLAPRFLDLGSKVLAITAVAALVSLSSSAHPLTGFQDLARIVCLVWAFVIFRQTRRPDRLLPLVMVGGVVNCVLALAQAGGLRPSFWAPWAGRHAIYGTFGNPNFLAEYLAPLAILILGRYLVSLRNRGTVAAGVVFAVFLSVLFLTVSRAAWLGFLTGLCVMVFSARVQIRVCLSRRKIIPLVIVSLMVAGVLWQPLWKRVSSTSLKGDPGIMTRTFMWRAAASMFRDRPLLGAGPGGFGLGYLDYSVKLQEETGARPAYAGITADAHSDILQLAAERGLLGIVTCAAALLVIVGAGVRRLGADAPSARIMRAAFLGAATTVMVESGFGFPMRVMPTAILFMWLLSCAAPPMAPFRGLPGWLRYLKYGLWGLPFLVLTARTMVADTALATGRKGGEAETRFRQGLRLLPSHGELHFRLGIEMRRQGRLDAAEEEYRAALEGFKDPDVFFNLGLVNLLRNRLEESVRWYGEGLRRYPFYKARPYAEMAEALMGLGRNAEAAAAVERGLAVDPDCAEVRRISSKMGLR